MTIQDISNGPSWVAYLVGTILLIVSFFLMAGKGSFLIAGYNTASKEKREQYDEQLLCRIVGCGLAIISVIILVMELLAAVLPAWTAKLFGVLVLADVLVMLFLMNTRARKK